MGTRELPTEVLSGRKPDTEYTVCLRVENTSGEEAISPGVKLRRPCRRKFR